MGKKYMVRGTFAGAIVAGAYLAATNRADAAITYSLLDLGTLGTPTAGVASYVSRSEGLNSVGQAAGYSNLTSNGTYGGFLTAPNSAINPATNNLGSLGGTGSTMAYGVNTSGEAVGSSPVAGGTAGHAFRTAPNTPINPLTDDLGTLSGATTSTAYGINTSGQVVGISNNHAFRTSATGKISDPGADLGTLGGIQATAYSVNDSGQTVGDSYITGNSQDHAFRTTATGTLSTAGADLGVYGTGTGSNAYGINASGEVVGSSKFSSATPNYYRAYITTPTGTLADGTATLFGTLGGDYSRAYGVDTAGDVVGYSTTTTADTINHAFYIAAGTTTLIDLNSLIDPSLGFTLTNAFSINDAGQIAGYGVNSSGYTDAFLLSPVPEPASLTVVGGALTLLSRRRFRKVTSALST